MASEASRRRFSPLTRPGRYWILRAGVLAAGLLSLSALAFVAICEYRNSRDQTFPTDAEVRSSWARAAIWILSHREQVMNDDNAMLWLFVREAGRASGDERLSSLFGEYLAKQPDTSIWRYVFDPDERGAALLIDFPDSFPDYNRFFVYGATCNATARADPAVVALLEPSACGSTVSGLRNPWCRTHQLMGLRFVQKSRCEPEDVTARTVAHVQDGIAAELAWDFRVQDAYIQKVMMLMESGRRTAVKAVWLRQILNGQGADGGWDGMDRITPLSGNRALYWADGRLYPRVLEQRPSNFHATAQALYLLALWLQRADTTGPWS